ncbi:MAG: hypothetical protein JSU01_02640 [Bacteroidetes bacterium]|nr:hypothetical protein [Bacteroidota bacterium]
MKKITLALSFLLAMSLAHAQTTIQPGDSHIRYDLLRPSHDFYRNVMTDTTGKVLYDFMMEDFTTIDSNNKQIVFARSRQIPAGSFSTDTSVTDLHFKPVRMHEIHYQRNVSFDMRFGDAKASVKTTRKGVESTKNYIMKSGYFEDNMIEYIFGYLDLKKGTTYTLDNFNKDTPSPSDPYTVEYAFDDVWNAAPDHRVYCTVLRFTHGGTTGYIWIDKSTHLMLKTVANFKTGSYVLTKV